MYCNWNLKGRWDPSKKTKNGASRDELIAAVQLYISERQILMEQDLNDVRQIVGYQKTNS